MGVNDFQYIILRTNNNNCVGDRLFSLLVWLTVYVAGIALSDVETLRHKTDASNRDMRATLKDEQSVDSS